MFVIVRSYLEQPFRFDFYNVAHEFLRREHQLVVDDPLGQQIKQTRIRMHMHLVAAVFKRLICP